LNFSSGKLFNGGRHLLILAGAGPQMVWNSESYLHEVLYSVWGQRRQYRSSAELLQLRKCLIEGITHSY